MKENYLAKWLNNELTDEELAEFQHSEDYATYKKIASATESLTPPTFEQEKVWEAIKTQRQKSDVKVLPLFDYRKLLKYAAAIALIVTVSYVYFNTLDNKVVSGLAERSEINLPDASKVFLNSESEVAFNKQNWDSERKVSLKGEGFFKVAKGKKFTVDTDQGTITVLGTQFNVEARDDFFEVTCYEGLVSVKYNNQEQKLAAGNSFIVVNGQIAQRREPINGHPSWLDNESSFKSIPLRYVLAELERQFDIKASMQNIDKDQLFTGTFSNSDLQLALKSISTPTQTNFKFLSKDEVLFYAAKDNP